MARKNILIHPVLTAQSLATAFTSPVTTITYTDNVSYQLNITTVDSTGAFAVEASNDYVADPQVQGKQNPGNWVALPLSGTLSSPAAQGASESILIDMKQLPFVAVRVRYTPTVAGTGTVDIGIVTKEIGG